PAVTTAEPKAAVAATTSVSADHTAENKTTVSNEPQKGNDETMEKTLKIEGMMCQHCQNHVHEALSAMDGVTAVTVDLEGKKADVTLSKDIPMDDFAKVIADAGYELVK
ncbi:MAG: heavy metal-associated domain-containing protein, partial [Megasphaera sp.]|nr:heavy metal-associated domain-containing protein [Megasphaera sp.]